MKTKTKRNSTESDLILCIAAPLVLLVLQSLMAIRWADRASYRNTPNSHFKAHRGKKWI